MTEEKKFQEYGYPDEQFETSVSDNLHCGICSCVLKDPVMCKNEHCFCRGCITKHLENSQTCPSCNQDLTLESLAVAPRIVRNLLSELRIRCDHHERGCQEIVQLENLASHVAVCGKAPVVCTNEECSSEINKEDLVRHESEECRFRKVKCRNCKEMGSMVQDIETGLTGLTEHVEKLNANVNVHLAEMKSGQVAVENKFGALELNFQEMENQFKNRFEKMENKFEKVENKLEKMENKLEKVENRIFNLEHSKIRDSHYNGAIDDGESAKSDQATQVNPSMGVKDTKIPNAYVVAGGYGKEGKPLNSAEIFDKTTNSWIPLQPIKKCRAEASSVVYNGQVLVAGGISDAKNIVSSMEQLNRNPNPFVPPFWSYFPINLPRPLKGHCNVLYHDRLIVLGGYSEDSCDMIYEIQLHFPYATRVLARLPSARPTSGCGVVLKNDKIFIFGGSHNNNGTSRVTMYDITKNEFQELAKLHYGAHNMATTMSGENVLLVGCFNYPRNCYERCNVMSYNLETQKCMTLTPMSQTRSQCSAVIDENSLVVMGGMQPSYQNRLQNTMEALDLRSSKWRELPSMNEARQGFIAETI